MGKFLFVSALSALILFFTACKPASTTTGSVDGGGGPKGDVVAAGHAQYKTLCAVCHGANGEGYKADNAPSLVNPTFLESASDLQLRRSIGDGRPGTSMAGYSKSRGGPLSDGEIENIVAWMRSRGSPTRTVLPSRPKGDGTRGAPIYAQHCEKCHGTQQNRGNAVHLANTSFLNIFQDPFLDWAIRKGRPSTAMDAWEGKLKDEEIDDVVAFVRSYAAPPEPASLPPPTGKEPLVINPQGGAPAFTPRSTPCGTSPTCVPDERFVSIDQVEKALKAKQKIIIIDARPPSDWMRVHIPGAVSIPYHDLRRLDEIPNDGTWVLAYCACPHHLSGDVVDALRKKGVKRAAILDEGILEWHRRGYPVVTAPGVQPPPTALAPPPSLMRDASH